VQEANAVPMTHLARPICRSPSRYSQLLQSLPELWEVLVRRRRLVGRSGGLLLACLLYCLIALINMRPAPVCVAHLAGFSAEP